MLQDKPWPAVILAVALVAAMAGELAAPLHRTRNGQAGRLGTNLGLGAFNAALLLIVPLSTVASAEWARGRELGLLKALALPPAILALSTVALRSLTQYGVHRLFHARPLLWRLHRVHHADVAVDLSTGLRNHPLELIVAAPLLCLAAAILGLDPGALALWEAVAVAFTLCAHANLRVPARFDRIARRLVVTPVAHHIHHAADRARTDSNYGDVLTLWDRVFGTYRGDDADAVAAARLGLGEQSDRDAASLRAQLLAPLSRRSEI